MCAALVSLLVCFIFCSVCLEGFSSDTIYIRRKDSPSLKCCPSPEPLNHFTYTSSSSSPLGCGAVYAAHRHSQQHGELPLSAVHVNQRQLPEQLGQQPGRRLWRQRGDGHDAGGRAHRHLQQLCPAQAPGQCKCQIVCRWECESPVACKPQNDHQFHIKRSI